MGYIDRLLDHDEEIVHRAKLPKTLFLPSVAALVPGLLALVAGWLEAAAVLLIVAGVAFVYAAVVFAGTELAVTNKRVIARVGTNRRPPWAVPLDQITEIGVRRGPLSGLLGYGTLRVRDVTDAVREVRNLARPEALRQEIESRRATAVRA